MPPVDDYDGEGRITGKKRRARSRSPSTSHSESSGRKRSKKKREKKQKKEHRHRKKEKKKHKERRGHGDGGLEKEEKAKRKVERVRGTSDHPTDGDHATVPTTSPAPPSQRQPGDAQKSTPPVAAAKRAAMVPMTAEQWQQQQSVVREELDPETGRIRLVRGTGEIIERIVSRNEHRAINRLATRMDGASFQASVRRKL